MTEFQFKPHQPTVRVAEIDKSLDSISGSVNAIVAERDRLRAEVERLKHELLAESVKSTEARFLEAENKGCEYGARKLIEIIKNGREAGVFGGVDLECATQAILGLRAALAQSQAEAAALRAALNVLAPCVAVLSRANEVATEIRMELATGERLLLAALASNAGASLLAELERLRQLLAWDPTEHCEMSCDRCNQWSKDRDAALSEKGPTS